MNVKESDSGQYVRYDGDADERTISKADWKSVNVESDAVVWSRSNGFHVPVEDISEEAWPYIEADDGLKLVKVDDVAKIHAKAAGAAPEGEHPLARARREAAEADAATQAAGKGGSQGKSSGSRTAAGGSTS